MPNFFSDNEDLVFQFNNLDLEEVVDLFEDSFSNPDKTDYAPADYEDAMENYRRVLEITGDIAGNSIAERASDVDEQGAIFKDGKVDYAEGTRENLRELGMADLMGMVLPRKYGGLSFPFTVYNMAIEVVSRADASLMNLFGLQDIADCINKYGTEEQREKYLPKFTTGEHTGAMALTEPDAGSDLQAVKMHAYQNEEGKWFLRGVKRFITNGNGDVHLVLARSEAGSRDGRGLSMFVCYNDETVTVRRIENKLGIHGSPTCELQFNDTPAELVGKRRFGLIKYVLDLMYRARMGVSSQALGIAQASYDEALKYAREREQFGKPIIEIPVIANMLIDMRVMLESNRSLLYTSARIVDLKEKYEEKVEKLKAAGESPAEAMAQLKWYIKLANLLTPMTKYLLTEASNKIAYDALQIHGGTGYMKEFKIERLVRDARITNIYEGTSQMQIVAASGSVYNDLLKDFFAEKAKKQYKGALEGLAQYLRDIREIYEDSLKYVLEKKDKAFQDVAAKDMVEIYSYLYIGYLLLDEAEIAERKVFIANRYIRYALSNAHKNAESIRNELFSDLLHAEQILI